MKIQAVVSDDNGQKYSRAFDLSVEFSFTPDSLWIIGLNEKTQKFEYRKISQIVCGKLTYDIFVYDVQIALIHNTQSFEYWILGTNCFYAEQIKISICNTCGDFKENYFLFDYEELKACSDYSGLTFVEMVMKVISKMGNTKQPIEANQIQGYYAD